MTATLRGPPARHRQASPGGGVAARRAVVRWAWRLFRREWRQQLLVLSLLTVAVAATCAGTAVAAGFPQPPGAATFGAASYLVTIHGNDPQLAVDVAAVRRAFGSAEVIESQAIAIPGSTGSVDLRAENPAGAYSKPLLALLAGQYPAGPGQVALTRGGRLAAGRAGTSRHRAAAHRVRESPVAGQPNWPGW